MWSLRIYAWGEIQILTTLWPARTRARSLHNVGYRLVVGVAMLCWFSHKCAFLLLGGGGRLTLQRRRSVAPSRLLMEPETSTKSTNDCCAACFSNRSSMMSSDFRFALTPLVLCGEARRWLHLGQARNEPCSPLLGAAMPYEVISSKMLRPCLRVARPC